MSPIACSVPSVRQYRALQMSWCTSSRIERLLLAKPDFNHRRFRIVRHDARVAEVQTFYCFSTRAAVIALALARVPFTSTVMPLTTPAHDVCSHFVEAFVVTVVDPTENVNAGHA